MHYASFKGRVYDDCNDLCISRIDFGSKFLSEALCCSHEHKSNSVFAIQLQNVKERCKRFLHNLIVQVEARLPANKEIFSGLSLLKPSKVLSHVHRASFSQLPFHHLVADNSETKEQYRKIFCNHGPKKMSSRKKFLKGQRIFGLEFMILKIVLAFMHIDNLQLMLWHV